MTDTEQRESARQFVNRWRGKGNEDEDGRSYWLEFLANVMGMENPTERVNFEKKVVVMEIQNVLMFIFQRRMLL